MIPGARLIMLGRQGAGTGDCKGVGGLIVR
jgi:hypothetical protein